jgi:hypothetical protein
MNERRLRIYLDDHLALMVAELELAARCRSSNRATALGEFLQQLENEVTAQKSIGKEVIYHTGGKDSIEGRAKQGAAWVAEKLGRFKLNDSLISYSPLSRVVELETLSAFAQGRIAMWDTLDATVKSDSRLQNMTFSAFRDQSQQHLDQLNEHRRDAAVEAFLVDHSRK